MTTLNSVFATLFLISQAAGNSQAGGKRLLDSATVKPSSAQVTTKLSTEEIQVAFASGTDEYPGINITPTAGLWNLSAYGHVEAKITNTCANPMTVALRIDNAGNWQDNPWDSESIFLKPGETGTTSVIFGYSYGHKKSFALDPAKVVNLVIFASKADQAESFRIESLQAAGSPKEKPPVNPQDFRVKPDGGAILGPGVAPQAIGFQVSGTAKIVPHRERTASFADTEDIARISPEAGRWDLSQFTQVRVTVRNVGPKSAGPFVRLETNGGSSPWNGPEKPLPPGSQEDIIVPFAHFADLNARTPVDQITSDAVSSVAISADPKHFMAKTTNIAAVATPVTKASFQEEELQVVSIKAELNTATVPEWLGHRPPVPGRWIKTLDDEFNGPTLNRKIWRDEGENYYDKLSHWSKHNVILGHGFARLRFEKKTGFQNDDTKRVSTPYAVGYLDTYGLWRQRYGYFEARIKVPTAPGLWPAFWMMPDRGPDVSPDQSIRQDTANGGMEFDIFEHLTRWGPHRSNIAMHYDGYGKDHKALGSDKIYAEPDKDGFITCGLLWLPGLAAYYYNGKEVLQWKSPRVSNVPSILMFTMPMGGWDNNELDNARLPADLTIDYVRVWQKTDP